MNRCKFLKVYILCFFIYPAYSSAQDTIKQFSEIYYEYRFALLDKKTPLNLEYNSLVQKYIDRYLGDRKKEISNYLTLSKFYFPIFEQYLDKYNLPLELKYLSIVESGLNPLAKSSSGAVGLWQFLYNSAPMFDLQITSYIDERRDIYKSTDAACKYFRYLYQTFNDWNLVLAAYNGGPGVVRNAVERSGGKTNLWDILPYMPEQTQNYVPAFLAMNYLMNYAEYHKIEPSDTILPFRNIDTVMINYPLSFSQIETNLDVPLTLLQLLNPTYKLDLIPETGRKHALLLPANKISDFLKLENKILSDSIKPNNPLRIHKINYYVEKGDFLHKIALKHNCNPSDIREWNNLKSDFISPGQSLIIWVENFKTTTK